MLLGGQGSRSHLAATEADLALCGLYTRVPSNISFEERLRGLEESQKPPLCWEVRVLRRLAFHPLTSPNCCVMLGNFSHPLGLELPLSSGGAGCSSGSYPWPCINTPGSTSHAVPHTKVSGAGPGVGISAASQELPVHSRVGKALG